MDIEIVLQIYCVYKTFKKIYKQYLSYISMSVATCQRYICIICTILVGIRLYRNKNNK